MGPVTPYDLPLLPPKLPALRHFDVTIHLKHDPIAMRDSARWIRLNAWKLRRLEFAAASEGDRTAEQWQAAMQNVVRQLTQQLRDKYGPSLLITSAVAAEEAAAAAAGAATGVAQSVRLLQLQSLVVQGQCSVGLLLHHLPANTLTQLECRLNLNADSAALCTLTTLQSLRVCSDIHNEAEENGVLAPLSALQRLTALNWQRTASAAAAAAVQAAAAES
jgi:hypothetical protein